MKIWFTSDPHFGHRNIIKYCDRPFADVEEMNAELIRRHNVLVKPDDLVYFLGDLSMSINWAKKCVPQLNGTKILIVGNHDMCHPVQKGFQKAQTEYVQLFQQTSLFLQLPIAGQIVSLSHFPYRGTEPGEHGEKYADWRPVDDGKWLLHGHVHQRWKVKDRQINVGVDQWSFAPVSYDEIAELIKAIRNGA